MVDGKDIWIKTGYEIFAQSGVSGLKIESLARKVGISKSSFYHHFADLELFMEELLNYHMQQSYIIADKEKNAKKIDPDLIDILVEHKTDLLFNRQLRINRERKSFYETLNRSNQIAGNAFVLVWVKDLNLQFSQKQLEGIFELALENFYLQINLNNLNHLWLSEYFANLKRVICNFAQQ
jgi:AcrR family transcriptional regulator